MKAEIRQTYDVSQTREVGIDWNGHNFLVIYGEHVNGWFISIPNWEICVEASDPTDIFYNTEKLAKAFRGADVGKAIAEAIKEHWEGLEK